MSYSGDPTTSPTDAVRFLIRDTDPKNELLSDKEIAYWAGRCDPVYGDVLMTAAFCADTIAGLYVGEVSISADGVSISGDQLYDKWMALGVTLRRQYKLLNATGAPLVGGISNQPENEPGVKETLFGIGMDDNQRAGVRNYGYRGNIPDWSGDLDGADY